MADYTVSERTNRHYWRRKRQWRAAKRMSVAVDRLVLAKDELTRARAKKWVDAWTVAAGFKKASDLKNGPIGHSEIGLRK